MPVRRGSPIGVGGLHDVVKSPAYATAVGLVKYGAGRLRVSKTEVERRPQRPERRARALTDRRVVSRSVLKL